MGNTIINLNLEQIDNNIVKTNCMKYIYLYIKKVIKENYKPIIMIDIDDTFYISIYNYIYTCNLSAEKMKLVIDNHMKYLNKILNLINEDQLYFITARVFDNGETIKQLMEYINHPLINVNTKIIFCRSNRLSIRDDKFKEVLRIVNDLTDIERKWVFFIDDIHRHIKNVYDTLLCLDLKFTCFLFDDRKLFDELNIHYDCMLEFSTIKPFML